MTSKDRVIVRSSSTGTIVKLPSGSRVRTLDRRVFDVAVEAANSYISERGAGKNADVRIILPVPRREPA